MTPTQHARSTTPSGELSVRLRAFWERFGGAVAIAILLVALAPFTAWMASRVDFGAIRFAGFDFALWNSQPWAIQVHALSAVGALLVGAAIFANAKGGALHRTLGWSWVMLMGLTAGSSLFITGLNGDFYSLIHVLSGWTLIALPLGVMAARRGDLLRHRKTMTGLFVGGLLVAGAFTFLPGRLMFRLFFDF